MRILTWSLVVISFHGFCSGSTILLPSSLKKPDLTQLFSVFADVCTCYCRGFLIYTHTDLDENTSCLNYAITRRLHHYCSCSVLILQPENWMETNNTKPHLPRIVREVFLSKQPSKFVQRSNIVR